MLELHFLSSLSRRIGLLVPVFSLLGLTFLTDLLREEEAEE